MRPIEITTVTDCGRVNGFTVTLPVDGTASFNRVGDACITTTTVVGVGGVYSLPLLKPGRWVATVADCRTGCLSHFPVNIPDLCPSFIPAVPKPACVAFCGYFGAPHALPVTTVSCCPAPASASPPLAYSIGWYNSISSSSGTPNGSNVGSTSQLQDTFYGGVVESIAAGAGPIAVQTVWEPVAWTDNYGNFFNITEQVQPVVSVSLTGQITVVPQYITNAQYPNNFSRGTVRVRLTVNGVLASNRLNMAVTSGGYMGQSAWTVDAT